MQTSLTFTFRSTEEADRCDLTRLGNVAAASEDGLTVKIDDLDYETWAEPEDETETMAVIRAAMAACGVWVKVE